MVRTIVEPKNGVVRIEVPEGYKGKKVEVLLFAVDEITEISEDRIKTHYASEATLAKDWLTSEEDIAWQNL